MMERLAVNAPYDPIEGAIHMARYALALPFVKGRHVLDVACGEGYGAWALLQAGAAQVDGVDFSQEAIGNAKITFKNANLKFQAADAEAIDDIFSERTFDVVISCETIEHLNNPVRFLRAIRKIAKDDAVIIITCPNDHWYYAEHNGNPHHRRKFTFEEFKALTQAEVGAGGSWHLGSASYGFATFPDVHANNNAAGPASRLPVISSSAIVPAEFRVPADGREPTPETCSYFVGIWNAPPEQIGGGAHHVISMDVYRQLMSNFSLHGEMTKLKRVETDWRITKVQAAALRKENDILALSVAHLRSQVLALNAASSTAERETLAEKLAASNADRDTLNAQIQELQRAFNWGEERIRSLDGSVAWHIERVVALESERNAAQEELQHQAETLKWHVERVQALESERDVALSQVSYWTHLKKHLPQLIPGPFRTPARNIYDRFARRRHTQLRR